MDVSLYSINTAVQSTEIINDISTRISNNVSIIEEDINNCLEYVKTEHNFNASTYLPLIGGKMSGGIVFGSKSTDKNIKELPGIGYNGNNLILAAPAEDAIISLWGSLSEEYGMNVPGITWRRPTISDNYKVPVYNYAANNLVWSVYNAGSLRYSEANYSKYYLLGITKQSYEERDFGETEFIAEYGNIETNVYVSRKNVYANAFYASSDKALKTNIKEIDSSTYIPDVIQFKWIDSSEISYGFLA